MNVTLLHKQTLRLNHSGYCDLLGVSADGTLYAEEFYDDAYLAQHIIYPDGTRHTTDEHGGAAQLQPIAVPADAALPSVEAPAALHFYVGAPLHGIRASDHVDALVFSLDMPDKMRLADALRLDVPPPMLIGLSESRVLAAATLDDAHLIVCRRVRLAHTLLPPQPDRDYATQTRHILQTIDLTATRDPLHMGGILWDEHLRCPTSCAVRGGRLYVADSGGEQPNSIHIYQMQTG